MKRLILILFVSACSPMNHGLNVSVAAQPEQVVQTEDGAPALNQLSEAERQAGWQLLFNGQDLSQWRTYRQTQANGWTVDQGAIHLAQAGAGDLISRQPFSQFELTLQWKISEAGNSGVFILADEAEKRIYFNAPEIQIIDNQRHADNKVASHLAGSIYDLYASPAAAHKPAGEWNQLRIRFHQQQLTVWQNDQLVVEVEVGSEAWQAQVASSKFAKWQGFGKNRTGFIGLQDHGDPVWFRQIKIRELQ